MTGRLTGSIAVVTGSNSGIGRAIALAYGREGAIVVCASRRAESGSESEHETTNDLIVRNGGKSVFIKMTFTETESVNDFVKDVVIKYGRIDVWVNNAGTSGTPKSVWELTDEDFDDTIDINLKGTFKCLRAAASQMIQQKPDKSGLRGRIINICSVFGPRAFPSMVAYGASKMGIQGLARIAAVDLAPNKITVNCIFPGTVRTAKTQDLPEEMDQMLKRKALMGYGEPEDIAGPAVLLACDEGKWIQGAELFIDGGYTIS